MSKVIIRVVASIFAAASIVGLAANSASASDPPSYWCAAIKGDITGPADGNC